MAPSPSSTPSEAVDPVESPRFGDTLIADIQANGHDPKGLIVVLAYRMASGARTLGLRSRWRRLAVSPILVAYRIVVEWTLGIELPPQVQAGPGLRIRHGQGLVVNTGTVLGANVMLRHNVTIGNIRRGPGHATGCPVVGDGVEFGAGAVVVGAVTIGDGALIGANAVVSSDVPAGAVVRAPRPEISGGDNDDVRQSP